MYSYGSEVGMKIKLWEGEGSEWRQYHGKREQEVERQRYGKGVRG